MASRQAGQPRLPPRRPYDREQGSDFAAQSLFPKLNPPLTMTEIDEAIMTAFQRTKNCLRMLRSMRKNKTRAQKYQVMKVRILL
jgi:hypothetical protein